MERNVLDLDDSADDLPGAASAASAVPAAVPTPAAPRERDVAAATVTMMTYNILAGGGPRIDAIEQVMRAGGADLIGVQEVVQPEKLEHLAERLGMSYAIAKAHTGWHVGLLSRFPILRTRAYSGPTLARALLEAHVELPGGQRIHVFVTHLSARFSERRTGEGRRLRELGVILRHINAACPHGEPHVLMGDFNSVAPGERFRPMSVLRHALAVDARRHARGEALEGHPGVDYILPPALRPLRGLLAGISQQPALAWCCDRLAGLYMPRAVVRHMRASGYIDCYAAMHPDPRTRDLTCPADAPGGRIDYIWATPTLAQRLVACEVLTDAPGCPVTVASDHRPLRATFQTER